MEPKVAIAVAHTAVKPAAGPLTLNWDLLITETINPPIITAIKPDDTGVFEAKEIPRHNGSAPKKNNYAHFKVMF